MTFVLGLLACSFVVAQSVDSAARARLETAYSLFLSKPDSAIALAKVEVDNTTDEFTQAYGYFVLSRAYWVKANYRLSTEYGFKALKFFERSPHERAYAHTLISTARTMVELGNYATARRFLFTAVNHSPTLADERITAEAYRELSYLHTELNQLDSALYYVDKGIAIFFQFGDSLNVSVLYSRKSRIFFAQKKFEESRAYAVKSVTLDTLVGNQRGLAIGYFQVAQNDFHLKKYESAVALLQRSIPMNMRLGNLVWQQRSHNLLAEVYYAMGKKDLAVNEFRKASILKDSLYNAEKSGQIQEMQSLYELGSKEKQIRLLEQENELREHRIENQQLFLIAMVVGMALLVLVIFFLSRMRRIQIQANEDLALKNEAIEEQKEAPSIQSAKLQQLNALQSKLFSVISHDLRGPINNLQMLLDLLTRKLMSGEEFFVVSDKLSANLGVTQRTLENLLNWSLSQMDGIKTERQHIHIRSAIEESFRLLEETALRKKITVRLPDATPVLVEADPNQLQLVLRNLIHNAIKFSKVGDDVSINVNVQDRLCYVTIKDNGIGMSAEEIDSLETSKNPFTKEGTDHEKGTGLGLLLCKEFIERNGGTIRIQSKPGEGTEIAFSLPLVEEVS